MAEMIGANARQSSAMLSLPVASFTSPNTHGPSHPPRLPTALIRAMPPAAAVPVSRALGSDQKTGWWTAAHRRDDQRHHHQRPGGRRR